uniref:Eukaryotic translation initiation factor 4 gamma 2 n=1 Tax=Gadus morhua TaxID=8049 RepID=A0A8C4ZZL3_GADMO
VESFAAEGSACRFSLVKSHGTNGVGPSLCFPSFLPCSKFPGKHSGGGPQRWVPSRQDALNEKGRHDKTFRKVRGILNKLTPEKFDKLCLDLLNAGIESKVVLKGIILLIVDKALEEPKYSLLYAQLCLRLAEEAPNFDSSSPEIQTTQKQSTTFRRILLSNLQEEFENRAKNVEMYDKQDGPLTTEEEEQRTIAKIKMLGNIKFIGELGKLNLIHESILHKCIKTLLEKKKTQVNDMGEDLECLCQIMRTVGPRLDHKKAKSLMDQYFRRMDCLMNSKELSARIRFLLQDIVELRENNWVPRKPFMDNTPKTINQIRQEAGIFGHNLTQEMRDNFFMESVFLSSAHKLDRGTLGGLADMFGQMPGSGIGTGPGVIEDCYNPNMDRHRINPRFNGHNALNAPSQSHNFCIFLRPAQFSFNKTQMTKLQPQTPNMIPPSAQPIRTRTPPLAELGLKANPLPIQEKPPKPTKKTLSKEEMLTMTEALLVKYLSSKDLEEAVNAVKEMKAPKHFVPEMLRKLVVYSLERPDEEQEQTSVLIHGLCTDGLVTGENLIQAFLSVLDQCPNIEDQIPKVKSYLAQFCARAIIADLVSIADLASPLENGNHFPLFLLCLQQVAKRNDPDWLTDLFLQSKVNMSKMLPECDQNKERMLEVLDGRGLGFLFPLMKLEKELLNQLKKDPSPQSIYKWIRDNISLKLHTDPGFVNILITSFLQFIDCKIFADDEEEQLAAPTKEQMDQEKQMLQDFKPVAQKFLHDQVDLQVCALYALQVHCNSKAFPKGMLLRYFVNLYDMEIIEEESFLAWREDIVQEFPGKGKALFQVNQWLTWLETAEEEESDGEED